MTVKRVGIAGTMESSDIMVTLEPNSSGGIAIELDSAVEKQFGREIRKVITSTLESLGISDAKVTAVDKGALNCAIRARVKAAAYRACEEQAFSWKGAMQ